MQPCPTDEDLDRYMAGRLPEEKSRTIDLHIRRCTTCASLIETTDDDEALLADARRVRHWSDEASASAVDLPADLGRYRILRRLGAGAMGVVYEAEQRAPQRRVALKVARAGSLSEHGIWRFRHEAEVLGRLDHPGIARIFESGTFEAHGTVQPFFVMELVAGRPLIEHAQEEGLPVPERLRLFARLCDAVDHAHRRGVIHRDLKPSNILVTVTGQPKVLDFGVARTLEPDLETRTLRTAAGEFVGTLPYMSPEQVTGDPTGLDTRSDVYALGVILHQILTGGLPLDVGGKPVGEAVRMIMEQSPAPLHDAGADFDVDLRTIVACALEKDRERRFASAGAFADDIRRFLEDRPIAARPPKGTYLLRKFVRRHRALVAAALGVVLLLIGGMIVTSLLAGRARDAEIAALRRQEETARALARAEATKTFLRDLFEEADPNFGGKPADYTLRAALDDAARRLDGAFDEQPDIEAELRITLGGAYMSLGLHAEAKRHLRRGLALREAVFGERHLEVAKAKNGLATLHASLGEGAAAESLLREVLTIYEENGLETDMLAAVALMNLGNVVSSLGRYEEGHQLLRRSLDLQERIPGSPTRNLAIVLESLSMMDVQWDRWAEAESWVRRALAVHEQVQGARHPNTASCRLRLATALAHQGRLGEAESVCEEALEILQATLPRDHRWATSARSSLAGIHAMQGRLVEARDGMQEVVAARRRTPHDSLELASDLHDLGVIQLSLGEHAQAEASLVEALDLRRKHLGGHHPLTARTLLEVGSVHLARGNASAAVEFITAAETSLAATPSPNPVRLAGVRARLARALLQAGHVEEAQARFALVPKVLPPSSDGLGDALLYLRAAYRTFWEASRWPEAVVVAEDALARVERARGEDHPAAVDLRAQLASVLEQTGDLDASEALHRRVLDTLVDPVKRLVVLNNLASVLRRKSDLDGAERLFREVLDGKRQLAGPRHASVAASLNNLGRTLGMKGELEGAEALFREAIEIAVATWGEDHANTAIFRSNLGGVLVERGRAADAEPILSAALRVLTERFPQSSTRIADARARYGQCLLQLGRPEEAEAPLKEAHDALLRALGPHAAETMDAGGILADTLEALGRPSEAAALRQTIRG